ncbi:Putative WSC domain-containing protein [[Torrubiella] hemipterigena]|uniref:Putative WSC domain-containing protein n=1 Tax=[Torrubiella] hemipterigena TaxID=1531966 RepID=A0A0A1TDY6_9HYPO|nr:Putative WSC domain-containing protein [[Torrubiella] hemipterigena]
MESSTISMSHWLCMPPSPLRGSSASSAAAYYIARTCDYAAGRKNCDGAPAPIAPPKGLRMVVGDPYLRRIR